MRIVAGKIIRIISDQNPWREVEEPPRSRFQDKTKHERWAEKNPAAVQLELPFDAADQTDAGDPNITVGVK